MDCLIWAPKFGTVEGKVKTTVVCRKKLSQLAFEEGKAAPETPVGPAHDPEGVNCKYHYFTVKTTMQELMVYGKIKAFTPPASVLLLEVAGTAAITGINWESNSMMHKEKKAVRDNGHPPLVRRTYESSIRFSTAMTEDSISRKLGSDGNLSIKSAWSSLRIKATKLIGCGVLFSYQNTLDRLSTEAEQLGWGSKMLVFFANNKMRDKESFTF
uniref:Uncharacterized protein n=1 Tax=Salix viminalis TaxID=40686 RepID=A0A6N2N1I2_SALVM